MSRSASSSPASCRSTGSIVPDPIAVGIDAAGVGWLGPLIKLGIILGLTSVILVTLLGAAADLSRHGA